MRLLVTGGAGFIGSNFIVRMMRKHSDIEIINYDKLTYAGNLDNLIEVSQDSRYSFVEADINDSVAFTDVINKYLPDAVVAFAAESHVDNSIESPQVFLETNILGSETILRCVRDSNVKKLVHISTDEVYGSLAQGEADENYPFKANSPYSASKAAGDMLCHAYYHTFGVPVTIIRGSNCYGPRQHPEKLIPKSLTNLLSGDKIHIYGDGKNYREWIFTEDFCDGVETVLEKGVLGEAYNLGSGAENRVNNLHIAAVLGASVLGSVEPSQYIQFVKDRAGHDKRYALNNQKLKDLGWKPNYSLSTGLPKTIEWYRKNEWWWKPLVKE